MTGSSGHRRVPEAFYAYLKVPVPPKGVQKLIASECEAIEQRVEMARSNAVTAQITLERLVSRAEQNGSPEKMIKLVEINPEACEPQLLFKTDHFVYVDISSVEAGSGRVDFSNSITPETAPSRARRIIKPHDILLSTVRPNLKSFAFLTVLPEKVLASTGFAVLRSKGQILPKYLYCLLFGSYLQNQMISKMGKGQYPSINKTDIENFMVPVISLIEQKQFVAKVEALEKQIAEAQAIIDAAPARKEAVMKKYL